MKITCSCVILCLITMGVEFMSCARLPHTSGPQLLLPSTIDGWIPKEADKTYNADTLYKYINGGAEVYRSFNVQTVLARRYAKPNAPDLIVDIFDMGSSRDAFGVYHHEMREGASADIGQDSELSGSTLFFWKGPYFISIMALDENEEIKRAVLKIGQFIDGNIAEEGKKPYLLDTLSLKTGEIKEVHYFHDYQCLNMYYPPFQDNPLNLDQQTEGVFGRFTEPTGTSSSNSIPTFAVIVIRYQTETKAQKAFTDFLSNYKLEADTDGLISIKNSQWWGVRIEGNYFYGVFDLTSRERTLSVLEEVKVKLKTTADTNCTN